MKTKKISLKDTFSNNVRKYRLELKISQEELAEIAGVHRTYIGSVERGERNITINVMEKICAAFKRPITDFF
ncbi:MAG: helix-turn-helix transcriptional regulator [Treponema sp.]|nr:helix-turn-helix transcriptional regulator [Treponema sp.]